uniref:Phycobilisome rod-core linker polypeptide n=1 Tax=Rhodochaete parvula TaxID=110510 RepID=A0A1C9CIC9_9RHOD|nr:phycobilisome rod-core linker protein [Rhodochaete parvula]ARO91258.1 phycobilisome rod-core linker polypeptide [Rhodochaete parvula]
MSIPLLNYSLSTQNQRVDGFESYFGEEQPKVYSTDNLLTSFEMDQVIWAAYRQIFSEHQILKSTMQPFLESQLRFNQITVKDFIFGLLLSEPFQRLNYDVNNNYRFVEMCVQRILGRDVYNEREKLAWAVIIGSKGFEFFINQLLDSDEYIANFGDFTVPYQRRRVITQRSKGEIPFNLKTPRYGTEFQVKLGMPQFVWQGSVRRFRPQEQNPKSGDPALFVGMLKDLSLALV